MYTNTYKYFQYVGPNKMNSQFLKHFLNLLSFHNSFNIILSQYEQILVLIFLNETEEGSHQKEMSDILIIQSCYKSEISEGVSMKY